MTADDKAERRLHFLQHKVELQKGACKKAYRNWVRLERMHADVSTVIEARNHYREVRYALYENEDDLEQVYRQFVLSIKVTQT